MPAPRSKPLVVFDGDCGYCRGWVTRWQRRAADRVDFAPFQDANLEFPEIPVEQFRRAVHLIDVDGSTTRGANAVFRILRLGDGPRWPNLLYRFLPGFSRVTELGYRFVATHRPLISWVTRVFWGDHSREPSHALVRSIFLRLLGVVYLIAFLSLAVQFIGLVGENGISPAGEFLSAVKTRLGDDGAWRTPTLCWFDSSDRFLNLLCYGGAGLSLLLILGVAPTPVLALLWIAYLSLVSVGDVFLRFQWDMLLLETGFLAIFLGPLRLWVRPASEPEPSRILIWLFRWLLFRLMLLSGLVKLWSGDDAWTGLTALNFHYETQPLPTWTSWYAHHWPDGFQKGSLLFMFAVELVCPVLIFAPRRLRTLAALATIALMLAIGLTGNYTYFNLLTITLCIPLLDDAFLQRVAACRPIASLRRRRPAPVSPARGLPAVPPSQGGTQGGSANAHRIVDKRQAPARGLSSVPPYERGTQRGSAWDVHADSIATQRRPRPRLRVLRRVVHVVLAVILIYLTTLAALVRVQMLPGAPRRVGEVAESALRSARSNSYLERLRERTAPMRIANAYGLFQSMTRIRDEIILEGSADGLDWKEYEFRWKPGDVRRPPAFVQPHQPRLDWQMWFAALGTPDRNPWFIKLMRRVQDGAPDVLDLLSGNPFPDTPPAYLRATLYRYRFTDAKTRAETGAWWTRERLRPYTSTLFRQPTPKSP